MPLTIRDPPLSTPCASSATSPITCVRLFSGEAHFPIWLLTRHLHRVSRFTATESTHSVALRKCASHALGSVPHAGHSSSLNLICGHHIKGYVCSFDDGPIVYLTDRVHAILNKETNKRKQTYSNFFHLLHKQIKAVLLQVGPWFHSSCSSSQA